jgi:hypothetical protein
VHLATNGSFGSDMTLSSVRRTRVGRELLQDGFRTMLLAEDADLYELRDPGAAEDDVRRTVTGLMSPPSPTPPRCRPRISQGLPGLGSPGLPDQRAGGPGLGWPVRLPGRAAVHHGRTIAEGQAGSGASNFSASMVLAQVELDDVSSFSGRSPRAQPVAEEPERVSGIRRDHGVRFSPMRNLRRCPTGAPLQ